MSRELNRGRRRGWRLSRQAFVVSFAMRPSPLSLRLAAATALGKVGFGIGERFGAWTYVYRKAEDEGRAYVAVAKGTC